MGALRFPSNIDRVTPPFNPRCDGCGCAWRQRPGPMLHDDLWDHISGGRRLLCDTCTKAALGRPYHPNDLTDCMFNTTGRWFRTPLRNRPETIGPKPPKPPMKLRRNHMRNQYRNRETTSLGGERMVSPLARGYAHRRLGCVRASLRLGFAAPDATSTDTSQHRAAPAPPNRCTTACIT